ncbi:structural maintenance of chromosomes protein [Anaeramoeba flamelloides]|uniref:Structural maintenance of chromosomes protein n=1 Tax=Anaeramoeba flamelloides TaxID=1746091 RepID=A0ABQ8YBJ4_9EUKA|nr:structural maintenance of chromosomes protein [Anaeramoeba flamelloides]
MNEKQKLETRVDLLKKNLRVELKAYKKLEQRLNEITTKIEENEKHVTKNKKEITKLDSNVQTLESSLSMFLEEEWQSMYKKRKQMSARMEQTGGNNSNNRETQIEKNKKQLLILDKLRHKIEDYFTEKSKSKEQEVYLVETEINDLQQNFKFKIREMDKLIDLEKSKKEENQRRYEITERNYQQSVNEVQNIVLKNEELAKENTKLETRNNKNKETNSHNQKILQQLETELSSLQRESQTKDYTINQTNKKLLDLNVKIGNYCINLGKFTVSFSNTKREQAIEASLLINKNPGTQKIFILIKEGVNEFGREICKKQISNIVEIKITRNSNEDFKIIFKDKSQLFFSSEKRDSIISIIHEFIQITVDHKKKKK